jgi:TonB-linked SusC/RagA family outer membrane protein
LYYEASINYAREFGKHSITALALFSRQKSEEKSDFADKREDYVGRVTYDYDTRYFAEFNGAYNGSAAFGPGYKFDFFPSVAVGWNISNEKFVKIHAPFIQTLKIKYSNGLVGNDKVGDVGQWPYLSNWEKGSFLGTDNAYPFGLIPVNSYQVYKEGTPGNPNLHWEMAKKQNLGTEFSLFKGLISGSVDLFKEHRYDMLVAAGDRLQILAVGQTAPAANVGIVDSKGMEIEGSVSKSYKSGFNFKVGGSWTFTNNVIVYKEDALLKPSYQKQAGFPIGQMRLNQQTGFIESWDDAYNGVGSLSGNTNRLPGDFIFTDYNANGKIDPDDDAPYGFPSIPRSTYTMSFNAGYKGWNMSVLFYGTHNVTRGGGGSVFMFGTAAIHERFITSTINPELGNANPTYPELFSSSGSGDANYYDGSLLRLKSVELSYTLPKAWTKFVGLAGARLYANGNNLFIWTKLPSDGDGDASGQGRNYPLKRTATIGANIQF